MRLRQFHTDGASADDDQMPGRSVREKIDSLVRQATVSMPAIAGMLAEDPVAMTKARALISISIIRGDEGAGILEQPRLPDDPNARPSKRSTESLEQSHLSRCGHDHGPPENPPLARQS